MLFILQSAYLLVQLIRLSPPQLVLALQAVIGTIILRSTDLIIRGVSDTMNNGCNVLHTVGGAGASLMHLPRNGQQRSVSQITM